MFSQILVIMIVAIHAKFWWETELWMTILDLLLISRWSCPFLVVVGTVNMVPKAAARFDKPQPARRSSSKVHSAAIPFAKTTPSFKSSKMLTASVCALPALEESADHQQVVSWSNIFIDGCPRFIEGCVYQHIKALVLPMVAHKSCHIMTLEQAGCTTTNSYQHHWPALRFSKLIQK